MCRVVIYFPLFHAQINHSTSTKEIMAKLLKISVFIVGIFIEAKYIDNIQNLYQNPDSAHTSTSLKFIDNMLNFGGDVHSKFDDIKKQVSKNINTDKFSTYWKPRSANAIETIDHTVKKFQNLRSKEKIKLKLTKNSRKTFIDRILRGGSNKKKKVLILMSDTGGGHRASARALDFAINEQFPGKIDVNVMDIWTDHGKWPFNQVVKVYRFLAKHPYLWRGFYLYGLFPPTKKLTEICTWNSYKSFQKAIEQADPDFVVSVHPLCHYLPIAIVQEMNKKRSPEKFPIPFVTVVTDLGGAHCTWFDNRANAFFVPSEAVRKIALKNGIAPEKIYLRGLPIRPSFWKVSKSKKNIRAHLGLEQKMKTVLLMGGGDGVGGLGAIASELAKKLENLNQASQMIVICGHNRKVSDMLKTRLVKPSSSLNVVVKGFVDNIDEFMSASDCLVTKAGPGTIAESMIRGLPLILSSYLPGQESGNVPYVVDGGFGVYTGNKPKKIAAIVSNLFNDDQLLKEMSKKAKKQSHPEATKEIAKDIGDFVLRKTPELQLLNH